MIDIFQGLGLTVTGALAYLGIRIMGDAYEAIFQKRVKKFLRIHLVIKRRIKKEIKKRW